jgi:hypothetical protein
MLMLIVIIRVKFSEWYIEKKVVIIDEARMREGSNKKNRKVRTEIWSFKWTSQ